MLDVRRATRVSTLEEEARPETVLYHKKTVTVDRALVASVEPRYDAITEVYRLDLRRWLAHTDDPKRQFVFADPDAGVIARASAPRVYNLGIVYGDLGQPHEAAQALERFLRSADRSMVLTERLEDAKKRLREYERTLSRLAVTVTLPADATQPSLFLDGALRTKLPSGNTPPPGYLFTAPGLHEVRVASSGLRDFAVSVELFPGELRKLAGALAPSATGDAALLPYATPPPSDESKPFYKRWWFWTAVGGGAVVLAGVVGAAAAGSFNRVAPGTDLDPIDVSR